MGSNSASDMEVSKKSLNITRSHHFHSDASKMLMRRSAFQAGLIPDCDSSRLVLCLEPEGVCFTALFGPSPPTHWNSDDFVLVDDDYVEDCRSEGSRLADIMRVEGSRFMVLDAGGGTVDLSSYEVGSTEPFRIKQLAAPTGGAYGSTQVDLNFLQFIRDLIGQEESKELAMRYELELKLLERWEVAKLMFEDREGEELQVSDLSDLGVMLGQRDKSLVSVVAHYNERCGQEPPLLYVKGTSRLVLSRALVKSFFQPSLDMIVRCVADYCSNTKAGEATYLILAGGYSKSPVLWHELRKNFKSKFEMLIVKNPDTAIVGGAVIFGAQHKDVITHRVSPLSYGTQVLIRYDPGDPRHQLYRDHVRVDQEKAVWIPTFDVHVRAGDEVKVGHVSTRRPSYPVYDYQTRIRRRVLSARHPDVWSPYEEGVTCIGEFITPVNMAVPLNKRRSETEIEFGGTELICKCYDSSSGEALGSHQVHLV